MEIYSTGGEMREALQCLAPVLIVGFLGYVYFLWIFSHSETGEHDR